MEPNEPALERSCTMEETSSEAKDREKDPATPILADQKLAAKILKVTQEAAKLKIQV
jgi:hypothetical protein